MDPRRRWFLAALALFLAWAGALAAMAFTSGREPPPRPAPRRPG